MIYVGRRHLNAAQTRQALELLTSYGADFGLKEDIAGFLTGAAREFINSEHWSEMEALARSLNVLVDDAALCNFYYDALKVALGCTAFPVETASGILHAQS